MSSQFRGEQFSNVDQSEDPQAFVQYLDRMIANPQVKARKERTLALMDIQAGHHVLDIGCGTGEDARAMAQLVGNTGRVVGLDNSATMIQEAQQRAEGLNLPLEFRLGDIYDLDFPDNSYDACHTERVFIHLNDPTRALAEMVRVTRPGGRIVLAENDHDGILIDSPDREVTRKIVHYRGDKMGNSHAGRQLYRLLNQAGLIDVSISIEPRIITDFDYFDGSVSLRANAANARQAGIISAAEATEWVRQLEEAGRAGNFFGVIPFFLASGRKP